MCTMLPPKQLHRYALGRLIHCRESGLRGVQVKYFHNTLIRNSLKPRMSTRLSTLGVLRRLNHSQITGSKPLSVLLEESTSEYDTLANFFPSRLETSGLRELFEPRTLAVVGATERVGSVGGTLVSNLIKSRKERNAPYKIYPVNPSRKEVFGLKCYPSLTAIPDNVDMAVIVTPAKSCVDVMRQCAEKKVKAAVVISAGFREAGPEGRALEDKLVSVARENQIRVVGPNCIGVMNPIYGLNATFAATMGKPGRLAFISQSGAMCTSVLDWSLRENVGFSAFVSVGGMADVNWGDLLDYLGDDPNTSAILMYMEGAGSPHALLSAAQEVVRKKPVIVIKAGKSEAAAAAAASHTGSLAGSYKSFEAAMHRVGITTVDNIQQLFDCASVLAKQARPKGPRLLMITNAGGPAVLATDAIVSSGAIPATLSNSLKDKLNAFLPDAWSHGNPVDILGDASPERYCKTLETILLDDEEGSTPDGVLVILSPQDVTDPKESAKALVRAVEKVHQKGKKPIPILAAWMGGVTVQEGATILSRAGIPVFSNPDDAASTFGRLWKQAEALDTLYQSKGLVTPLTTEKIEPITQYQEVFDMLKEVKNSNRTLLTEEESKRVLKAYGLDVVPTRVAINEQEAIEVAKSMGESRFAVKLHSKTLTHKADVGGVRLNVPLEEVSKAFRSIRSAVEASHGLQHFQGVTVQPMITLDRGIELILGSTVDPQFGPLVMFGSGGSMVEIFRDTGLALPPLTPNLSDMLIKKTRIYKALKGAQGKRFQGVDLDKLKDILHRFSRMVLDLSDHVIECDINPLLATRDNKFIALDARFVLGNPSSPPVIRPCPYQYTTTLVTHANRMLHVRPVVATDMLLLQKFLEDVPSEDSYRRYLTVVTPKERVSVKTLTNMCFPDYDRRLTLLAMDPETDTVEALVELERPPKTHLQGFPAHLRLLVKESQNPGLTHALLEYALKVAKEENLHSLVMYRLKKDATINLKGLKGLLDVNCSETFLEKDNNLKKPSEEIVRYTFQLLTV